MFETQLNLEGFLWQGKPILSGANEENKTLDESLKEKKIQIQRLKGQLELEKEKNKLMRTHQGDLNQELFYTQQIYNARRHEFEQETNSKKLLDRERSRLTQEMNTFNKDISNFASKRKIQEDTVSKYLEKIDNLKTIIQWEEEALLKFLQKTANVERDKIALSEYSHEDDFKLKDLELQLERLGKDTKDKKAVLDDMDTDVFVAQSELDRLQTEFKDAHNERSIIISNWEKVLQQTRRRNNEIENLSKHMDALKTEEINLNQKLKEQKLSLSFQLSNNKDTEKIITERTTFSANVKISFQNEEKTEENFKIDINILKNISHSSAYQTQTIRNEIKQIDGQIDQCIKRITNMERSKSELENTVDTLIKETFDTEYYSKQLNSLLSEETKTFKTCQCNYNFIVNSISKHSQDLVNIHIQEKQKDTEFKNVQATSRNQVISIHKLDAERLRQQGIIYKINLCIENLEKRVRLMQGEVANEEERTLLEKERLELQTKFDEKTADLNFVTKQIKHIQERSSLAFKTLNVSKTQYTDLKDRIDFLDFYIVNSKVTLKVDIEKKEVLMVDNCLSRLQFQRFRDLLRQRNANVIDLRKSQAELEMITKKRFLELKNCCQMVLKEIHRETEETYQTKRQLQEYKDKVDKLQTKYDMTLNALGIPDSTEIHSEVLIKTENDKRVLQQERDVLVTAVVQKEEELQAFRNTVWLIQNCIEQFKRSLNPPGISQADFEQILEMEEEYQQVNIQEHDVVQNLIDLNKKIPQIDIILNEYQQKIIRFQTLLFEKSFTMENLDNELNDLNMKLLRAKKTNSNLGASALEKSDQSIVQNDLKIHQLRDLYKYIIELFFSNVSNDPLVFEKLKTTFEELNVSIPPGSRTTLSSRNISSTLSLVPYSSRSTSRSSSSSNISKKSGQPEKYALVPAVISLGSEIPSNQLHRDSSSSSHSSRSKKLTK